MARGVWEVRQSTREGLERAVRELGPNGPSAGQPASNDPCPVCSQPIVSMAVAFWGRARLHGACLPEAPARFPRRLAPPPGQTPPSGAAT